jgi:hypothetical protein
MGTVGKGGFRGFGLVLRAVRVLRHPVLGSQEYGLVRVLSRRLGILVWSVVNKYWPGPGGLHLLLGTGALSAHRYLTDYADSRVLLGTVPVQ